MHAPSEHFKIANQYMENIKKCSQIYDDQFVDAVKWVLSDKSDDPMSMLLRIGEILQPRNDLADNYTPENIEKTNLLRKQK